MKHCFAGVFDVVPIYYVLLHAGFFLQFHTLVVTLCTLEVYHVFLCKSSRSWRSEVYYLAKKTNYQVIDSPKGFQLSDLILKGQIGEHSHTYNEQRPLLIRECFFYTKMRFQLLVLALREM